MTYDGPPSRHLHPVDDQAPFDPDYDTPTGGGRRPPQDRRAEQAVLAALIHDEHAHPILDAHLDGADFYWPEHARIWETWHDLHDADAVPPDAVTINARLIRDQDVHAVRALADLTGIDANPALIEQHARIVRDASRLRVVDETSTFLRQVVEKGRADTIEHSLAEALQRLDETITHLGTTDTSATTGQRDLSWILGGTPPEVPEPVWVRRGDGTCLFYAGKVNGVFGDPESAKTWLAQLAVVEALNTGHTAAMIDVDHNGADHTAARLILLGARMEYIADPDRFQYYEPEDGDELRAAVDDVVRRKPAVVLIDSLGEIFPMLGVKTNDGDEITAALRLVCTRPAIAGACVITIDHLPKSTEARTTGFAIGSIAKKRMIRGAYLRAEVRQQPAPGHVGRLTLRIEKDTMGSLRKSSGGGYAGTFTLDSTQPHVTTWSIGRDEAPKNDDGTFRPTSLMERVSRYVEDHDQCTFTDIKEAITAKDKWLRDAIHVLVTEGFIARIDGPRRAKLHHSNAPYRETEDDHVQNPD